MNNTQKILLTIFVLILLVIGFYFVVSNISKLTGFSVNEGNYKNSEFESCLNNKKVTLYINSDDANEALKQIVLFDYLKDIIIINCKSGNSLCKENSITTFPSWQVGNDVVAKDISLNELSVLSGCRL